MLKSMSTCFPSRGKIRKEKHNTCKPYLFFCQLKSRKTQRKREGVNDEGEGRCGHVRSGSAAAAAMQLKRCCVVRARTEAGHTFPALCSVEAAARAQRRHGCRRPLRQRAVAGRRRVPHAARAVHVGPPVLDADARAEPCRPVARRRRMLARAVRLRRGACVVQHDAGDVSGQRRVAPTGLHALGAQHRQDVVSVCHVPAGGEVRQPCVRH